MSQSTKTNGASRGSSLSNAVSSLVRAQYGLTSREASAGGAEASTTTDLDKHVAELLLQEAREREARAKASNSATAWSFSDEEDGPGGKTFTSRTNKRFLTNVLKGVEEHNAPLRRKEGSPSTATAKESLDDIRRREREARERRLGRKDAERTGRDIRDATSAATSTSATGDRRAAGPGFAARMLANGLSGALASREDKTREEQGIKAAINDARRRAERDIEKGRESSSVYKDDETSRDSRSSQKGKERARDDSREDDRHRTRRTSKSRERDERSHRSSGHRSRRDYSSDESDAGRRDEHRRRHRERSRSPRSAKQDDKDEGRQSRRRDRDRRKSGGGTHRDDRRRRSRSRSNEPEDDSNHKRSRRRSPSSASDSLSEHASEASSDTFIDYTGATDVVDTTSGGGSKMDKYFSSNYNPALDISVADLEDPKTGLIGEGNFSEWDKMLHTLKKRKEDKLTGVTKAREEERERQLRKLERRRRREERELRHALKKEKKRKKRQRSSSESGSESGASVGPKKRSSSRKDRKRSKEPAGTVVIDGFEYGKRGSTRAWDLGKDVKPF